MVALLTFCVEGWGGPTTTWGSLREARHRTGRPPWSQHPLQDWARRGWLCCSWFSWETETYKVTNKDTQYWQGHIVPIIILYVPPTLTLLFPTPPPLPPPMLTIYDCDLVTIVISTSFYLFSPPAAWCCRKCGDKGSRGRRRRGPERGGRAGGCRRWWSARTPGTSPG